MKKNISTIVQAEKGTYENVFGAESNAPGTLVVDLRPSVEIKKGLPNGGSVLPEHLEIVIRDGISCRTFDLHWNDVEGIYAEVSGPKESESSHRPPITSFPELPDRTGAVYDIFDSWTSPGTAVVDLFASVSYSCHYLIVGRKEMADHLGHRTYAKIGIVPRTDGYAAEVLEKGRSLWNLTRRWPSTFMEDICDLRSEWEEAAPWLLRDVFWELRRDGGTAPLVDIIPLVLDGPHHAVVLRHLQGDRQTISVVSWTAGGSKTEDFASYPDLLAAYPEADAKIAQFFRHNPGRTQSKQE